MMKVRYILSVTLLGAALVASFPVAASEQDPVIAKTLFEKTYLNGGIGKAERDFMRSSAHEFSLRLTFLERNSEELIADVPVEIVDAEGSTVFKLPNAGPMLYVMLPKGKYKITASFNGVTNSQVVTLGGKVGKDLYFQWHAAPEL